MADEMENMQSENQNPAQNEMPEQAAPAVEAEAEAPVKKRRGRPPKKRPEGETEAEMDAVPDLPLESAEEKSAAPVRSAFGSDSAAHSAASRGNASDSDFGDDGDYDPASVQHVDSFTPSSRKGLKAVRTYKFSLDDDGDFDGDPQEQEFPGGIRPNEIVVAGMNESGGASVDLPPDDDSIVYVPPTPKTPARMPRGEAPMPDFPDDDGMETRSLGEQAPAEPRQQGEFT